MLSPSLQCFAQATSTPPAGTSSNTLANAPAAAQPAIPAQMVLPEDEHTTPKHKREAEKLYLHGAKAIEDKDVPRAYQDFSHAHQLDPANRQYSAAREVARQHLVTVLIQEAEKARLSGHSDLSRAKLAEGLDLDPKNPFIAQHVQELASDGALGAEASTASLYEQDEDFAPPISIVPAVGTKSFHLKGTQQEVLRQVLSAYQITPVMDSSVTQKQVRLDVDDVTYAQAAEMAKLLTGTFFVPLDPKRVLVANDTKENRTRYERLLVESVYLPGLTATEMTDVSNIARNIFETPVAVLQPTKGILTVRAPEDRMNALNGTLAELLDGRAQVVVDVRLYDVDRTRTTNIGIALPQQTTVFNVDSELNGIIQNNQAEIDEIVSSGLASAGDYAAILGILIAAGDLSGSVLDEAFRTFGGGITQFGYSLGTVTGNLSLNSSDVRSLDEIHLRVQDQETATFRVGSRYPIVTSTLSSGGTGSSIAGLNTAGVSSALAALGLSASSLTASVTIPQIQYEDLGLTLKATPRVQHGQEVALNMDLKFVALGGTTLDDNPILNNRQFTATVTLRDGASALIVSSLSRTETKAITGLPGLNELPGLRSATDDSKDVNVSNLVLLVTPHIVRRSHMDVAGREFLLPRHN